ncbi:hypothetical protein HYT59_01135 [Candidatus Woesebacteria bacterium]|nr:hypothetical protein [Candidatus Woesebacteria bacterium]
MNSYNQKLYACYLDLRRAAVSFYKAPQGSAHEEFMTHALKILNQLKEKKLEKFKKEIVSLRRATSKSNYSERERMNIADKILTTGILLR